MSRPLRNLSLGVSIGVAIALVLHFAVAPRIESRLNRVTPVPLPPVAGSTRALHGGSTVVDMHADSLLFGRDLLRESHVGHVDLPRLQRGGVALQFLTIVTVSHAGTNPDATDPDDFDLLTLMGLIQLNRFAVEGPFGRALLQAGRWQRTIEDSGGMLIPVRSRRELDTLLERRSRDPRVVGTLLGVEGAHALEGDVARLDALVDAGVRMIGLAHFFDNEFAGSAHGLEKGGLSEIGRALVDRMQERGVLIDLAHVSPRAVADVLDRVHVPTVVSHGGVQATCPGPRNLSDEQIRRIARGGGVIGIGYFELAVCGRDLSHIVAAMAHVSSLVGPEHVALGSDFDGGTETGFDTSQLPALTQAMRDSGFDDDAVRGILGANALRVLRAVLPER